MSETSTSDTSLERDRTGQQIPEWLTSMFAPAILVVGSVLEAGTRAMNPIVGFGPNTPTFLTSSLQATGSTAIETADPAARFALDVLFDSARDAIIEDGMFNVISRSLPGIVLRYTTSVLPQIASAIENERISAPVAAEILKELGKLREPGTHSGRRWLLERALNSPSPITRDGASLGLARLKDRQALPSLLKAMDTETDPQARRDLQLVVDELLGHGVHFKNR